MLADGYAKHQVAPVGRARGGDVELPVSEDEFREVKAHAPAIRLPLRLIHRQGEREPDEKLGAGPTP